MTPLLLFLLLAASCSGGASNPIPAPGPLEEASAGTACAASPIYLLVSDDLGTKLVSFDPRAAKFNVLGAVTPPDLVLFEGPIAVDHSGQVYAVDNGACGMERIYRIKPSTLAVESTPAAQSRDAKPQADSPCISSMAFVSDASSPVGETLYLHTVNTAGNAANPYRLGRVDATSSAISDVAGLTGSALLKSPNGIALSGTAKGELYAALDAHASLAVGTEIDSVDSRTAAATFRWQLNQYPQGGDLNFHALAIWEGDFYLFVASATSKQFAVIRFRPSDSSAMKVATSTEYQLMAVASSQCTSGT